VARTTGQFFPDLADWMGRLADGRDGRYILYEQAHLLWVGLLISCLKLAARHMAQ
jgi:hypothetical protein